MKPEKPTASDLIFALSFISEQMLTEAEKLCYEEHELKVYSDSEYFIIMRRLRLLRYKEESK